MLNKLDKKGGQRQGDGDLDLLTREVHGGLERLSVELLTRRDDQARGCNAARAQEENAFQQGRR